MKQCNTCEEKLFDRAEICGVCRSSDFTQLTNKVKPEIEKFAEEVIAKEDHDEENLTEEKVEVAQHTHPQNTPLNSQVCKKCKINKINFISGRYCSKCHADYRANQVDTRRQRLIQRDQERDTIARNRQGKIKRGRG